MLVTIDTQEIYKSLVSGGFSEEQAETVIDVMRSIDLSHLATKSDIQEVKSDITLLKWMLGFLVAGVGSIVANTFFG